MYLKHDMKQTLNWTNNLWICVVAYGVDNATEDKKPKNKSPQVPWKWAEGLFKHFPYSLFSGVIGYYFRTTSLLSSSCFRYMYEIMRYDIMRFDFWCNLCMWYGLILNDALQSQTIQHVTHPADKIDLDWRVWERARDLCVPAWSKSQQDKYRPCLCAHQERKQCMNSLRRSIIN
jgi:hypothetical protein